MDQLVGSAGLRGQVHAQIGSGSYEPKNMTFERFMNKAKFDQLIAEADSVVSHAGVGTIATALALNKPLLVMPRLRRFGEHVNDHQVGTAVRYAELGHVLLAEDSNELAEKLAQLSKFKPRPRFVNAEGIALRIDRFLRVGM